MIRVHAPSGERVVGLVCALVAVFLLGGCTTSFRNTEELVKNYTMPPEVMSDSGSTVEVLVAPSPDGGEYQCTLTIKAESRCVSEQRAKYRQFEVATISKDKKALTVAANIFGYGLAGLVATGVAAGFHAGLCNVQGPGSAQEYYSTACPPTSPIGIPIAFGVTGAMVGFPILGKGLADGFDGQRRKRLINEEERSQGYTEEERCKVRPYHGPVTVEWSQDAYGHPGTSAPTPKEYSVEKGDLTFDLPPTTDNVGLAWEVRVEGRESHFFSLLGTPFGLDVLKARVEPLLAKGDLEAVGRILSSVPPVVHSDWRNSLTERIIEITVAKKAQRYLPDCERGSGSSCFELGELYREVRGLEQAMKEARNWYQRGCSFGYPEACIQAGGMHVEGRGGAVHVEEGAALFLKACEMSSAAGCFKLGTLYADGALQTPKEKAQAMTGIEGLAVATELYWMACDEGNSKGCRQAREFLKKVTEPASSGAEECPEKPSSCLQAASALEDCAAMEPLYPNLAASGRVAEQCRKRQVGLLGQGCDNDDAAACLRLGLVLERSGADPSRYVELYEEGCNMGQPEACTLLASVIARGQWHDDDCHRAKQLLSQACEDGHKPACSSDLLEQCWTRQAEAQARQEALERRMQAREEAHRTAKMPATVGAKLARGCCSDSGGSWNSHDGCYLSAARVSKYKKCAMGTGFELDYMETE